LRHGLRESADILNKALERLRNQPTVKAATIRG
jgi:hypothetical protein